MATEKQREANRKWKREHREFAVAQATKYRQEHPEKAARYAAISSARLKAKAILKLGSRCRMCKIDNPLLLTISHKNGDGNKEPDRRPLILYRQIIGGERDDLELLCYNCQKQFDYNTGKISRLRADLVNQEVKHPGSI